MIYFAIMLLAYFLTPLYAKGIVLFESSKCIGKAKKDGRVTYIYLFSFILICIIGLRSVKIGLDTPQYYFLFDGVYKAGNFFKYIQGLGPLHAEWGYILYEWVLSRLCQGNYYLFLFITGIITMSPVMWIIYKYSKIPWLSIVLFILFGYFTFYMTGLRQAIALGFCIIAFHYSYRNKLLPYLLWIFIGFLFHQTALIFLPVYWVKRIKLNKFIIFLTAILIGFSFAVRSVFYNLFMLISRIDYTEHEDAGGIRMYLTMLLFVIMGFIWIKKIKEDELSKSLFYMMIICVVLWPILSTGSPAVYRLYYYYHIFIILYSANLAKSIKNAYYRNGVIIIFVLIGFAYFTTQIISKPLNVYPYYFSWEVPVDFNTLHQSWDN
jgi:hypothetical protein